MSDDDLRDAVLLAFLAGAGIPLILGPVILPSVTASYADGVIGGFWSAFLVVGAVGTFLNIKDADEEDAAETGHNDGE